MTVNPNQPAQPGCGPGFTFLLLFLLTFFGVVVTATLITFILPESYAAKARIRIVTGASASTGTLAGQLPDGPTEAMVIQSAVVLTNVIAELDLNATWGKRYGGGEEFKTTESLAWLKARMDVRPVRETSVIEIKVFSEDRVEAAELANQIARAYGDYVRIAGGSSTVELIDAAVPATRPARPNKPLNLALGIMLGGVGGTIVGGLGAAGLAFRSRRRTLPPPIP